MPKFKGTGIVVLEKLLNQKSPDAFQQFKEDLTAEERDIYDQTMPISWIPVEIAAELSEKAAHILYPKDPDALMKLGMARAHEHVNGVYKIIMKMISVNTVMERSAKLWRAYHDKGEAWVQKTEDKNEAYYCVAGYPELPEIFHNIIRGYSKGLLEIGGAKNVQTEAIVDDPNLWRWKSTWE